MNLCIDRFVIITGIQGVITQGRKRQTQCPSLRGAPPCRHSGSRKKKGNVRCICSLPQQLGGLYSHIKKHIYFLCKFRCQTNYNPNNCSQQKVVHYYHLLLGDNSDIYLFLLFFKRKKVARECYQTHATSIRMFIVLLQSYTVLHRLRIHFSLITFYILKTI